MNSESVMFPRVLTGLTWVINTAHCKQFAMRELVTVALVVSYWSK